MKGTDFNLQPEILQNNLVTVKPLKEEDFERLLIAASDPLIWEQHPDTQRYKREVFKKYFDASLNSKSAFLVFDTASKELIGCTRYHDYDPANNKVSLGYTFLTRKYWGGLYNRAMKELLLDYAFQYVESVILQVGSTNTRAERATQKLGAHKVNEIDFDLNGMKMIVHEYEIKRLAWKAGEAK